LPGTRVSVLLIAESDRAVAVADAIEGFQDFACALERAHSVAGARALLQETEFQAVLVGSGNRDSLESEVAILRRALPDVAVIALPESDDAQQAQRLIQAGADDVTPIGTPPAGLERALATALQRAAFGPAELDYLVRLARGSTTAVTSSLFGSTPLRLSQPALFEALVARYSEVFDSLLEALSFRTENDLKEQLRALAHRLGELNARPRDVIELHTAALGQKMRTNNPARVRGYVDEGKMLVLELMGYLVSFYRSHAIGIHRRPTAQKAADAAG
jgi:DNA-binding NarL/FixJ family response regulator